MSEISKLNQNLIIKKIDKETINLQILNNKILAAVVGEFNQNLIELEKLTKTTIFFRGNSITIKGKNEKIQQTSTAIKFLVNKFLLTNMIEKSDIVFSVKNMNFNENKDSNVKSLGQLIKTPKKSVIARSEKQSEYIKALKENEIIMSLGPAGTGKSFLAVSVGVTMLMEKKIDRVILSRPAVEAGEKLGFLPGDLKEKVDPFLRPIYDALYEMMPYDQVEKKLANNTIEIAPIAFMRGRTLEDCYIILDEAQNTTKIQMKMFLTRLGKNSKMVVVGDNTQIDLISKNESGLIDASIKLKNIDDIGFIELDQRDVIRHEVVRKIINAYENKNSN